MTKEQLEHTIKSAFFGVTLEDGISLKQAQEMDNRDDDMTHEQFQAIRKHEVLNDWTQVTHEVLKEHSMHLSWLDAKGFRYYIPALMLDCLHELSEVSDAIIFHLRPSQDSWDYQTQKYSQLDERQLQAIACFVRWFPEIARLDSAEQKQYNRALSAFWHQFLGD